MKSFSLILIIILAFVSCQPTKTAIKSNDNTTYDFPKDWVGEWEGQLKIYKQGTKTMELYTGLVIAPLDSGRYTWTIIYGEGEQRQERKYELFAKDASKGHYQTDEKNSIFLDDFLVENKLFCRFEVMSNLLLSSYEFRGENIIFEIVMGKIENIIETGGLDSIPKVNSYDINVVQRAVMKRKETNQH